MSGVCTNQDYNHYTIADHNTWTVLSNSNKQFDSNTISREYLDGLQKLELSSTRIIDIPELSNRLEAISGWTLVPVTGLLPNDAFFRLLRDRQYPITIYIREPSAIDFSEQPDIFHDVIGHVPLLTNKKFIEFLRSYSRIALEFIDDMKALEYLGRLYWYTYEMGLIKEDGAIKPYGGAIITSAAELKNVQNINIPKHSFDVSHIFCTPFNSFKLQKEYFVIDSFDDLFGCTETLPNKLEERL